MKKQLFSMNEQAFFLPYVSFLIAIVFIVVISYVYTYQNDLFITEKHIEQIKIETLFQRSREEAKKEFIHNNTLETEGQLQYTYPDGNVVISYVRVDSNQYQLHYTVQTENHSDYTFTNPMFLTTTTVDE